MGSLDSRIYQLTKEQELLLEERRRLYKSGKAKALTISEFRKLLEKKTKRINS